MVEQNTAQDREESYTRSFNPNEHLVQLKSREGSKDYLPVQWRLVWFREQCPEGTIDTEEVVVDLDREVEEETFVWNAEKRRSEKVIKHARGYARFRAIVTDGKGGRATGTKSENAASFGDYVEKAETGAIGRALAALGYGTQFAPEMNEAHRIVDAPVERQSAMNNRNSQSHETFVAARPTASVQDNTHSSAPHSSKQPSSADSEAEGSILEQQLSSIRKLSDYLNKPEPENLPKLSFVAAKKVIQQLTAEYKEAKQNSKAS
ncbi:hypothetical protein [Tengunoibacter tsumagoiensis]|uniref:Uncharacterized protein n=1 Tax=Tengunoibacter tsumagoiensis TaxID=2014871 RepID=A0A401ZW80_9CHLR|nr:hypothetical protein [Tengunoibacter tsumagoiensis]GCE11143.1 hypothetical protein KTT_10020 [Tengunoibacter tsumagoiensis]